MKKDLYSLSDESVRVSSKEVKYEVFKITSVAHKYEKGRTRLFYRRESCFARKLQWIVNDRQSR